MFVYIIIPSIDILKSFSSSFSVTTLVHALSQWCIYQQKGNRYILINITSSNKTSHDHLSPTTTTLRLKSIYMASASLHIYNFNS